MLQEESCKKLAELLTKAYIQSHMKEFSSRIDVDVTRLIK